MCHFSRYCSVSLLCWPGFAIADAIPLAERPIWMASSPIDEFASQRQEMVERQLRDRSIRDENVLAAMAKVPRHRFVPGSFAQLAYGDYPLPIGRGQTISQPYVVAYMTEAADISPDETVLEIGTGSGYQAAVLGEIARDVYTVEIIPGLAARARQILKELDYRNVRVKIGDGYRGWVEHAPYDAIIVTAAPDHIPQPLVDQLASDGKMVIPVGRQFQEIVVLEKTAAGIVKKSTLPVRFVPLVRR